MTQRFNEWVRDNFFAPYDTPDCEQSYEAGAASREEEVSKFQEEIDDLKKRINEAMVLLEYNEYKDSATQALDVLKGE